MNFAKFLRIPFPTEHFRWLLLINNIKNSNSINGKNYNKSNKSYNNRVKEISRTKIIETMMITKTLRTVFPIILTKGNKKENINIKI